MTLTLRRAILLIIGTLATLGVALSTYLNTKDSTAANFAFNLLNTFSYLTIQSN